MKQFFEKNLKNKVKIFALVLCLGMLIVPFAVNAAEYLSENDPIVTLSYLKEIFAPQVKEEIRTEIATYPQPSISVNVGYEVLELSKGQKLTSVDGTVELIVRPGSSAQVVSEIEGNGLSDISEMKEVLSGETVGINHALIIPRADGRGIVVTSEKAYVLVRGAYAVGE